MPIYQFLRKPIQIEMFGEIKHWLRELFYCDDAQLFNLSILERYLYPWSVLLDENPTVAELKNIIEDPDSESKAKILAHHLLADHHTEAVDPELLGIVLEVKLEPGLNAFAIYQDGTFSYINQSDKVILVSNPDYKIKYLSDKIFEHARAAVEILKPQSYSRPSDLPIDGFTRISFLVGHKLYIGEGPSEFLFNDSTFQKTLMGITIALGIQIARETQPLQ